MDISILCRLSAAVLIGVCFVLSVSGESSTNLNSQTVSADNKPVTQLGKIVVTANRDMRDPLLEPSVKSAALDISTSIVDAETIERQGSRTLADAIDYSTGVFTERRGRKEHTLSSFRGQIYPYPDYAFNGVWQRAFSEVPSFFPAIAIERIEILRSGGAVMAGPNSGLVGVINIVPRRFDERTTLIDTQFGSYGTYEMSLLHGDREEKSNYTVGANFYSTDGPGGENAGERFASGFGTWGWEPNEDVHIEFTGYALTGERELRLIQDPGSKSLQKRVDEKYSPYTSAGGTLRALVKHNERSSSEMYLGYVRRDGDYSYHLKDSPEVQSDETDWEYNAGIIHSLMLSDNNVLRLGAQYNHWSCPDGKRYYVGERMDVDTVSAVIADEHTWERLTLDGGLRFTKTYYRDYSDVNYNINGKKMSGSSIDDEWGDDAYTGTLGAKYDIFSPFALYAHATLGMVDAPPGAVAESSNGVDRELRTIYDFGVSAEDEKIGEIKTGVFAVLRDDAILLSQTVISDDDEMYNSYENNDVRQYGVETEFRTVRLLNHIDFFGNITAMDSERDDENGWTSYREIPGVTAAAGVGGVFNRMDMNLIGKYVSGYENKRFAENKQYHNLGEFFDLSLNMGVTLNKEHSTRIYTKLQNILDDEYSTVVGYPDYGFQIFGGIQHKF